MNHTIVIIRTYRMVSKYLRCSYCIIFNIPHDIRTTMRSLRYDAAESEVLRSDAVSYRHGWDSNTLPRPQDDMPSALFFPTLRESAILVCHVDTQPRHHVWKAESIRRGSAKSDQGKWDMDTFGIGIIWQILAYKTSQSYIHAITCTVECVLGTTGGSTPRHSEVNSDMLKRLGLSSSHTHTNILSHIPTNSPNNTFQYIYPYPNPHDLLSSIDLKG